MLHRLILKVTKFQLPPPKRLSTVFKNIWGAVMPPLMSNRVKETSPSPKVNKQRDQLQQILSNARMCLFLLNFSDQSWGYGTKASYFFRAFSDRKLVTVCQQECFRFERIGISPIFYRSPSLRFSLPLKPPVNSIKNGHSRHILR